MEPVERLASEFLMEGVLGDWIEWKGGAMPVPMGTPIEVRHRDGDELLCNAGTEYSEDWTHGDEYGDDHPGDITAYRIVNP